MEFSGLGVGTAAVGYLFKDAAFLKRPAAIAAVGASIGKQVYGVIATRKAQAKAKAEQNAMTPTERVALAAAEAGETKTYYVPPIVRFLTNIASSGDADLSKVGG